MRTSGPRDARPAHPLRGSTKLGGPSAARIGAWSFPCDAHAPSRHVRPPHAHIALYRVARRARRRAQRATDRPRHPPPPDRHTRGAQAPGQTPTAVPRGHPRPVRPGRLVPVVRLDVGPRPDSARDGARRSVHVLVDESGRATQAQEQHVSGHDA